MFSLEISKWETLPLRSLHCKAEASHTAQTNKIRAGSVCLSLSNNPFLLYPAWMHHDQILFGQKKTNGKIRICCGKHQPFIRKTAFHSWKFNFLFKNLFNKDFLPNASSSRVEESHGWAHVDGRTYTQFHFIPTWGSRYRIHKSARKEQSFYYAREKHSQVLFYFPAFPFLLPCLIAGNGPRDQGSQHEPVYQTVQHRSADGIISKAHLLKPISLISHIFFLPYIFLLIAEHSQTQKWKSP